jgi:hypothetical protein
MTLAQNISVWDTLDFQTNEKKSYVQFSFDPLAGVCACIREGKSVWAFFLNLEATNSFGDTVITADDEELAAKIRKYFLNKNLIWILKNPGRTPSKYRQDLYRFLENGRQVDKDHFRILITLPQFYEEDKLTLKLFENYNSLPDTYREGETVPVDSEFEYVGRIQRNSQKAKLTRYYFKNRHNRLLLKGIVNKECGKNLMDYIIELNPSVKILGQATAKTQTGFDFRLLDLHNFELLR